MLTNSQRYLFPSNWLLGKLLLAHRLWGPLVLVLGFGLSSIANSLYGQQRLEIGSPAPGWVDLLGTDDQKHSLADLQDYDFVVVCFTCNTCPYAIDYEDRLIALHQRFQDGTNPKVAIVAINSNATPDDQLDKMKERSEQKRFPFWYLRDDDHQVAKEFKALYTPEFFVLDRERKIRYQGALDNKTKAEEVTQQFVVEVIETLAKGQEPSTTYQPARGCKIRFPKPKRDLD
ncbi:MAG: thioredoxin family protein [Planctomycetaceae bacterium]|nr:thioredoxin family protein [Planctomycetaceae bacterium]